MLEIPQENHESTLKLPIENLDEFLQKKWPINGAISFKDVELRYRPKVELVLRKLTFNVAGG